LPLQAAQGEVPVPQAVSMPSPAPPPTWERQAGESDAAFRAFECFRLQGSCRTLDQAWRLYFAKPRPAKHKRTGVRSEARVPGYMWQWSKKWRWLVRCDAWDAQVREAGRDRELDRALDERGREQEEAIAATRRRRQARQEAEAVSGRVFHALLGHIIDKKALENMPFADLLYHAPRMAMVMTSALRQARLEEGQSTENVQVMLSEKLALALGEAIREFVPRENWREAAARVTELVESANGNGKVNAGNGR